MILIIIIGGNFNNQCILWSPLGCRAKLILPCIPRLCKELQITAVDKRQIIIQLALILLAENGGRLIALHSMMTAAWGLASEETLVSVHAYWVCHYVQSNTDKLTNRRGDEHGWIIVCSINQWVKKEKSKGGLEDRKNAIPIKFLYFFKFVLVFFFSFQSIRPDLIIQCHTNQPSNSTSLSSALIFFCIKSILILYRLVQFLTAGQTQFA